MARKVHSEFLAREQGDDKLHHIGVEPGDGSNGYIANFVTDYRMNSFGDAIAESTMMVDISSMHKYEFIDAETLNEVSVNEVIEQLR